MKFTTFDLGGHQQTDGRLEHERLNQPVFERYDAVRAACQIVIVRRDKASSAFVPDQILQRQIAAPAQFGAKRAEPFLDQRNETAEAPVLSLFCHQQDGMWAIDARWALILRSGVFAASRRMRKRARGPSFETPRKRAAPQDEGVRC